MRAKVGITSSASIAACLGCPAVFAALGAAADVKGDGDLVIVVLGHAASSLRQLKGLCDQLSQDWH